MYRLPQVKIGLSVKLWLHCLLCVQLSKFFICNIVQFAVHKMAVLTVKWQSKIKSHSDAIDYFKELPFYNKSIKKPKVKRLKNINIKNKDE